MGWGGVALQVAEPRSYLMAVMTENMVCPKNKQCFSKMPFFSVMTDIKYRGSATGIATPLYGNLALDILES